MVDVSGGRAIARQLRLAGIDTIFAIVAGPMTDLLIGARQEGLRVVSCRHEATAGFMAMAWGYVQRKSGVLVVGSGPGMTNAVTPMHVATASAMPLVVLGGSTGSSLYGLGGFQEANQLAFAAPACKWVQQVPTIERIPELVHLALGKAVVGRPGAVYLDFPGQIVSATRPEEGVRWQTTSPRIAKPHPDAATIQEVAKLIREASSPVVLVGKGAAWADAGEALLRLAELGVPYISSPMARGVIPDDHPQFMNAARSLALKEADLIVMFGARFNWMFGMGRPPVYRSDARIVQIDLEAEELYSAANVEIGIIADAAAAAEAIVQALDGHPLVCRSNGWLRKLELQRKANELKTEDLIKNEATPISPWRLVGALRDLLPRDAIVTSDGEIIMGMVRMLMPAYGARSVLNGGTTACIGTGLPYAIGAKLARPEVPVVAVLGDYAFGAALAEVETAVRVGANVVFVVANNEGVCGHMLGDELVPVARLLPADYQKVGEMVGAHVEHVMQPADLHPALMRALGADRPAVVHVRIDPKIAHGTGTYFLG